LLIHRKLDAEKARRILERQYLTDAEIKEQIKQGAVKHPSNKAPSKIKSRIEINNALTAFDQGVYVIVVDGQQVESLDDTITLTPHSKITFMKMTPLVGG
jgi:hypothetical protein